MYGVLFAAALRSPLAARAQPSAGFTCRCPVDVRPQLIGSAGPMSPHGLGCFVDGYDNLYVVNAGGRRCAMSCGEDECR